MEPPSEIKEISCCEVDIEGKKYLDTRQNMKLFKKDDKGAWIYLGSIVDTQYRTFTSVVRTTLKINNKTITKAYRITPRMGYSEPRQQGQSTHVWIAGPSIHNHPLSYS